MWTHTPTPKINRLKRLKGIYVLVIDVEKDVNVKVGALGQVFFKKGLYAYVGSAQNNLELRLKRHLRKDKRIFWHIDYLLVNTEAKVSKLFYKEGGKAEECLTAEDMSRLGKPVRGFGCSDCRCKSHLYYVDSDEFLTGWMEYS